MKLRPYQQEAVDKIREEYRAHRSVLFVLPTGGGKTATGSYMVGAAAAKGRRVLWLAHREQLVEQASDAFRSYGVEHGLILSGRDTNGLPVQVGMIGTVARRLDRIARPDFIIVDEAHHATSATYRKIIDAYPAAKILGLTATPQRTDGTGLGDVFGALVEGPSMMDLVKIGALSKYRAFIPPGQIDTTEIKTTAGDFNAKQLAAASDQSVITGDAVEHYMRLCAGKLAVAFCTSRLHAEHVAEHFCAANIPAERIDGTMDRRERQQVLARYSSGETKVLTSCDLISEGFDLPAIEAAILLRPTKSLIVYLQQVGRALRPAPDKDAAIILDHAGNIARHGFPDDLRQWSLKGREKGQKRALNSVPVTTCGSCFLAYQPALPKCPYCGAEKGTKDRTVQYQDGVLIEITPAMEREGELRTMPYQEAIAMAKSVEDLLFVAKARGYKKAWCLPRAIDAFGLEPRQAALALGFTHKWIKNSTLIADLEKRAQAAQ